MAVRPAPVGAPRTDLTNGLNWPADALAGVTQRYYTGFCRSEIIFPIKGLRERVVGLRVLPPQLASRVLPMLRHDIAKKRAVGRFVLFV
jgi:hypothetical protein